MDTIFATLACYLLVFPFAVAQTQEEKLTVTPTIPSPDSNMTHTTATTPPSSHSTGHITVISNSTENTTPFTATTRDKETSADTTAATSESTSRLQTSQSTTDVTPPTNSTLLMTTTPGPPTSAAPTATQTTVGYTSPSDTTRITTANSSHTVNTTSESTDRTTRGLGLNMSEKNMTIVFSVVLGVFVLAVVAFMFHKCKHKIQYLHQPLNNTDDTADEFVTDDDTLVISGGLYDGHPIYDNVPTVQEDQSQFRLQFLH